MTISIACYLQLQVEHNAITKRYHKSIQFQNQICYRTFRVTPL